MLKADKSDIVVITYIGDYYFKVHEFISNNQFSAVNTDPTNTFQKEIRNVINNCVLTIHKDKKNGICKSKSICPQYEGPTQNT